MEMNSQKMATSMLEFAIKLWPLNRSITGNGVRETLAEIKKLLPELSIHELPSGMAVFDWTVPYEWRVSKAYIISPKGEKICDFSQNNLHLVGYSHPLNQSMGLEELQSHLHSLPDQPNAIPYVTSYYKRNWGFCMTQNQRDRLEPGIYQVIIDSELFDGCMTYAELLIRGRTSEEVFLSTYVCHPSMANNELSGPTVTTYLAKWLLSQSELRYSYRIIFVPETIGSIAYLSRNLEHLKKHVIAGFNISCVGDERAYSYLPSRAGNTLSDMVAKHVLKSIEPNFKSYTWSNRGSDERQYCAPGVDLPIASIMRTKYGEYPEYHTSLDDFNVVTSSGLEGGYEALRLAIELIENNIIPKSNMICEPQMGKYGLYPMTSTKNTREQVSLMMDVITWSDGSHSLLEIAEKCRVPIWKLYPIVRELNDQKIISITYP